MTSIRVKDMGPQKGPLPIGGTGRPKLGPAALQRSTQVKTVNSAFTLQTGQWTMFFFYIGLDVIVF